MRCACGESLSEDLLEAKERDPDNESWSVRCSRCGRIYQSEGKTLELREDGLSGNILDFLEPEVE